jgi:hypothetical protein
VLVEGTTGLRCCVWFGYCSNTSSSFPFSLYFCGSLFLGSLRCLHALKWGRRSEKLHKNPFPSVCLLETFPPPTEVYYSHEK